MKPNLNIFVHKFHFEVETSVYKLPLSSDNHRIICLTAAICLCDYGMHFEVVFIYYMHFSFISGVIAVVCTVNYENKS